jgi:hypothetical protein
MPFISNNFLAPCWTAPVCAGDDRKTTLPPLRVRRRKTVFRAMVGQFR